MKVALCQCDKPPANLVGGRCTVPATQEDLLCDVCRNGCQPIAVKPDRSEDWKVLSHVGISGFFVAPISGTYQFGSVQPR
jgi:hypothetical protein